MNTKRYLATCILLYSLFSANAFAAQITLASPDKTVNSEEVFSVTVALDSEDAKVNALEGVLVFPSTLEVEEVRDGNSIVNFWVDRPHIETAGAIAFSGVLPGGYQGTGGYLFTVLFKAHEKGKASISLRNAIVYQNDGKSTPLSSRASSIAFAIEQGTSTTSAVDIEDTIPPEAFQGTLVQHSVAFDGKAFVVFATQDKGSGIGHYEVKEGVFGEYVRTESPYLLLDQSLDKKIYIRAFDKKGNERTAVVYPPKWRPWENIYNLFAVIAAALVAIYFRKRI
jgi:hypothetical protein